MYSRKSRHQEIQISLIIGKCLYGRKFCHCKIQISLIIGNCLCSRKFCHQKIPISLIIGLSIESRKFCHQKIQISSISSHFYIPYTHFFSVRKCLNSLRSLRHLIKVVVFSWYLIKSLFKQNISFIHVVFEPRRYPASWTGLARARPS